MALHDEQRVVLVADDDEDDRLLIGNALHAAREGLRVEFVGNGEELLAYLRREGDYADPARAPRPHLVLLDLNMPRMDGWEALVALRGDPALAPVPVVVLTTSHADGDVANAYRAGANSYLAKPPSFDSLLESMRLLVHYWFDSARLPPAGNK